MTAPKNNPKAKSDADMIAQYREPGGDFEWIWVGLTEDSKVSKQKAKHWLDNCGHPPGCSCRPCRKSRGAT